jgi:thiamine biosynthesis protein ThiS
MEKKQQIVIRINDLPEQVPAGSNLETLIQLFNERDSDLIVELNGRFIYSRDYATTIVSAGDEVEFLNPNFGG